MKAIWVIIRKPLIIVAYIAAIILLALYVYNIRQDFAKLLLAPALYVALLMLFGFISSFAVFYSRKICIEALGYKLSPVDYIGLPSVTNLSSYILPLRGDLLIGAAYYKRKYGLAYASFVSVAAFENVLAVLIWLLVSAAGLLTIGVKRNVWPGLIWLCITIAIAIMVAALFFASKLPEGTRTNKVINFAGNAIHGLKILLGHTRSILLISALQSLSVLCNASRFYILYAILGEIVPLENILVYTSISLIVDIFAIIPGNIGIKETILGFTTSLLSGRFEDGVLTMLIIRASGFLVYLVMGLISAYPVHKALKSSNEPKSCVEDI